MLQNNLNVLSEDEELYDVRVWLQISPAENNLLGCMPYFGGK